jgi:hypothetical protein
MTDSTPGGPDGPPALVGEVRVSFYSDGLPSVAVRPSPGQPKEALVRLALVALREALDEDVGAFYLVEDEGS